MTIPTGNAGQHPDITRRRMLMRLGLATTAIYVAPMVLKLSEAKASASGGGGGGSFSGGGGGGGASFSRSSYSGPSGGYASSNHTSGQSPRRLFQRNGRRWWIFGDLFR